LRALENAQDFVLAHDQILIAIDLDVRSGILAEQNAIPRLHIERDQLPVFGALALADGYYFAFLGLFLGRIGNEEPADLGFFLFDSLDHDAVIQRTNLHTSTSL